jgi:adenosylcobinamide kinase/adenosylcobinamide-phosphate guanylyltransferase
LSEGVLGGRADVREVVRKGVCMPYMRLVVGGAYQGKLAFARGLVGDSDRCLDVADGERDSFEAAFCRGIVCNLHAYIRRFCEGEADKAREEVREFVRCILQRNPGAVVVCDLLGCGIVPMRAEDRLWRELTGEACQVLAGASEEVYRVICGIPQRLKGKEL